MLPFIFTENQWQTRKVSYRKVLFCNWSHFFITHFLCLPSPGALIFVQCNFLCQTECDVPWRCSNNGGLLRRGRTTTSVIYRQYNSTQMMIEMYVEKIILFQRNAGSTFFTNFSRLTDEGNFMRGRGTRMKITSMSDLREFLKVNFFLEEGVLFVLELRSYRHASHVYRPNNRGLPLGCIHPSVYTWGRLYIFRYNQLHEKTE